MDCLFYRKFQTRQGPLKILLKTPGALARRCEYYAQFSLKRMCKATTLRTSKTNLPYTNNTYPIHCKPRALSYSLHSTFPVSADATLYKRPERIQSPCLPPEEHLYSRSCAIYIGRLASTLRTDPFRINLDYVDSA